MVGIKTKFLHCPFVCSHASALLSQDRTGQLNVVLKTYENISKDLALFKTKKNIRHIT